MTDPSVFSSFPGVEARDAVVDLAQKMAGLESVKDDLRTQLARLDVDHSNEIDKQELKSAVEKLDLSAYGLNITPANLDLMFEELDVNHDGKIAFSAAGSESHMDEMFTVVLERLYIKDDRLSDLLREVQYTVDELFLRAVMLEDKLFAQTLFPDGLPKKHDGR
eukprot:SAG22_NODE_670_length_7987_cov_2.733519_4_plen_164_part_00